MSGSLARRLCAVCGRKIPHRLGIWSIYCSSACARVDGAE